MTVLFHSFPIEMNEKQNDKRYHAVQSDPLSVVDMVLFCPFGDTAVSGH